jgi:hypothetical protein
MARLPMLLLERSLIKPEPKKKRMGEVGLPVRIAPALLTIVQFLVIAIREWPAPIVNDVCHFTTT